MKVLDLEKKIGVTTFLTNSLGMGGKLRFYPEDFIVAEKSLYPQEKKDGKFTVAEVTSTGWETNLLVRELSNRLHMSRQRVGFAGTKDKRAKTTQLMSFYKVKIDDLSNLKIKGVEITNIYRSDKPVKIGTLLGNKFEITIRNIREDTKPGDIEEIWSGIHNNGGFPNFFGVQRFGIIRPITHIVGKHIVDGDFEKAVMTYIANPIKGEDEDTFKLRKKLQETRNYSDALNSYPDNLNFEKAILNKLVNNPDDFVSALKELPKNLLTMFVYAYQSYLFNEIICERIKRKIPLNQAIEGDIVLPLKNGIIEDRFITVSAKNIEKVNQQLSKQKAVVSTVLFGSDSVFSQGEMGEIEKKIIESEKFDPRDFIIPEIPFISSSCSRRSILAFVKDFDYKLFDDETTGKALTLKFELLKGCYATSFLREFMKAEDIRNY